MHGGGLAHAQHHFWGSLFWWFHNSVVIPGAQFQQCRAAASSSCSTTPTQTPAEPLGQWHVLLIRGFQCSSNSMQAENSKNKMYVIAGNSTVLVSELKETSLPQQASSVIHHRQEAEEQCGKELKCGQLPVFEFWQLCDFGLNINSSVPGFLIC